MKFWLSFPFLILGSLYSILVYNFDRTFRKTRFAVLQAHQVFKPLIDSLYTVKYDIFQVQERLDSLISEEKFTKKQLKRCKRILKNKYGIEDIDSVIDKNFLEGVHTSFKLSELMRKTLELESWAHEIKSENPKKKKKLKADLVELERIRDRVEYTLINLNNHISNGYIKRSEDILKVFEISESEELLKYHFINMQKCGLDAYL